MIENDLHASPWLSKEEVCTLTGWSVRHLQRLSASGEITFRSSTKQLYRGQPAREYSLTSLPAEARGKYLAQSVNKAAEAEAQGRAIRPAAPDTSLALIAPAQIGPVRVALPASAEKEALRRIAILKPLLDFLRDPVTPQLLTDGSAAASSEQLVADLATRNAVSVRTIWRWKMQFDASGRMALARKPRVDKNRSAWAAENRDLAALAALVHMGNGEQPAQSVRAAWEAVCERAENQRVAAPSYETVRAFLRNPHEVPPSMLTYGRQGRRKYEAQFAPFITRGYTEPANSIWMSDHMIHDVLVQNDAFGARDGKHMRLQMTAIFDYRSRYILAAVWSQYGSSHSIKRGLLQAFTKHGLPDRFYCDNGKDYLKVGRGASTREMASAARRGFLHEARDLESGVLQRLGIPVTYCMIYHGQSKGEERWHGTVHERFDRTFVTYTAGETHLRPEATTAAAMQHGKLLRMGRAAESQLPTATHFIAMCEAWIEQWYHQQPHGGRGMDGRTPAQVFEQERGVNRPCPEPAVLAMLLAERATRKVSNCQVELEGDLFVPAPDDQLAWLQMHELSSRRVTVAYDPLDPMFAAVLDGDGNFICKLQRKDLMRFSNDEETRRQVKGLIATRNGQRKAVTSSIADLNRRVRANGYVTLAEQHEQRLELPRAVGDNIVQPVRPPAEDSGFKELHSADIASRYFQRMGNTDGAN